MAFLDETGLTKLWEIIKEQHGVSDNTKNLYGLDPSATTDNIAALLHRFPKSLGNEYLWKRTRLDLFLGETAIAITDCPCLGYNAESGDKATLYYSSNINASGLVSPITLTVKFGSESSMNVVAGKYWSTTQTSGKVYYSPVGATASRRVNPSAANWSYVYIEAYPAHKAYTDHGFVNDPASNAYPPPEGDEYTYTALGRLGDAIGG